MKILFVMRHPAAVRSLTGVLRLLDERGHRVHLAFGGVKADAHRVLQRLSDECPGLTFGSLPNRGSAGWVRGREGWNRLATRLRLDSDYLRYLEPSYADAPALRARAEVNAHPLTRRLARVSRLAGPAGVRALRKTLAAVERCLDPPPHIERFVLDQQPDVLIVPHLARESVQNDYVRAAKRLGIPTAYPVFSWDNLTNKGLVHELPDRVLVWNELQADEAVELQGISRDRVRVLGAWSYDHWFDWRPSRSREEFCATVGLRADRPIILYVCSSTFVAPDEAAFIGRWIDALRARGGVLAEAGVIVRPHPRNTAQWAAGATYDDPQVTIWPAHGEEPLETSSRENYFDSIYHSAAVVGINTSAQIEGAVVGRPVHTVLADEFRETQQGTLHFQYLQSDDFGHLEVGRTLDEHLQQLETSIREGADTARNERFLRRFVRPLGLDVPATPLYADALEELAAHRVSARKRGPALAPAVRWLLRPLAAHAARRAATRKSERPAPPDQLRAVVRRLRREQVEARVIAGPWVADEVGELLYWIPFLRWAQTATYGLRDRLVVVARAASATWYEGIGAELVRAEDADAVARAGSGDAVAVPASLVESHRGELAARGPSDSPNYLRRRLDFQPLTAPELPDGLQVPEEFLAVRFAPQHAQIGRLLAAHGPLVDVEGLDRSAQAAVLARSRGFAGTYGVEAYLAVLLGVPAIALPSGAAGVDEDDARLTSRFLTGPAFGDLHVLDADAPPDEVAKRAARLVQAPGEALARV